MSKEQTRKLNLYLESQINYHKSQIIANQLDIGECRKIIREKEDRVKWLENDIKYHREKREFLRDVIEGGNNE